MTKLTQVFVIGGLIRFILPSIVPKIVEILASTVEISTPINSFKSLQEAFYYLDNGINLYDGGINTNPPLYVVLMSLINNLPFKQIWFNLVFTVIDLIIAWRLIAINKWYNKYNLERSGKHYTGFNDDFIASFYLFNPLILLTNLCHSSLPFSWLFLIESISQVVLCYNYERAMILLAISSYLTFTPIYLFIPILAIAHSLKLHPPTKIYVIGGGIFYMAITFLMFASFAITASWHFAFTCYGTIIFFDKISPNIGLWWYLFTEMFQFFTPFYVGIFNLYHFIFIIPISIRLFEYKPKDPLDDIPLSRLVIGPEGKLLAIDENGYGTEIKNGLANETNTDITTELIDTNTNVNTTGIDTNTTANTTSIETNTTSTTSTNNTTTSKSSSNATTIIKTKTPIDYTQVNGDSFLGFVLCYFWLSFSKSYPTIGDLGFGLSLIPIFKSTVMPHCRYPLISGLVLLVCLLLSPIFYYCWIVLGNGNSNFFYSINLIWGVAHALIIIDLFWAQLTLDYAKLHKLTPQQASKLRLTQI